MAKKKKKRAVQKLKLIVTLSDLTDYLKETKKALVIPKSIILEVMQKVADNVIEKYRREGKLKRVLKKVSCLSKDGMPQTIVDFLTPDNVVISATTTFEWPKAWQIDLEEARKKPTKYEVLK